MSEWTPEAVVRRLGKEAQVVPGCIMVYRDRHIIVMEVDNNGFRLTPEGEAILDALTPKRQQAPKSPPPEEPAGKGGAEPTGGKGLVGALVGGDD